MKEVINKKRDEPGMVVLIPALGRQRQEDREFEASLGA
jgi:hypothetical protein